MSTSVSKTYNQKLSQEIKKGLIFLKKSLSISIYKFTTYHFTSSRNNMYHTDCSINKYKQSIVGLLLMVFVFYTTWVFWSFWRTYDTLIASYTWYLESESEFMYWYWNGNLNWGYWYWYWYWYWGNTFYNAWYYGTVTYTEPTIDTGSSQAVITDGASQAISSANWVADIQTIVDAWASSGFVAWSGSQFDFSAWVVTDTELASTTVNGVATATATLSWTNVSDLTKSVQLNNSSNLDIIVSWNTSFAVTLPASLQMFGTTGWDGKLDLPKVAESTGSFTVTDNTLASVVALDFGGSEPIFFDQVVTLTLPNVTSSSVWYYTYGTALTSMPACSSGSIPSWSIDCYVVSWTTMTIKTYHLTTFVSAEATSSSSSSSSSSAGWNPTLISWWGWWWGFSPYYSQTKTTISAIDRVKSNISKKWVIATIDLEVNNVEFKKAKFQDTTTLLNNLIGKEAQKAQLIWYITNDKTLASKFIVEYTNFLKWLSKYESKEISKSDMKKKIQNFLIIYKECKSELNLIMVKKTIGINGSSMIMEVPIYESEKITNIVNLLSDKIANIIHKKWYKWKTLKWLIKIYQNVLLSIKVYKETDKKTWKKLWKQYLKELITYLSNTEVSTQNPSLYLSK